jgi:hypothetical protein
MLTFQERYLLMMAENYKAKADAMLADVKAHQWLLYVLAEVEEVGFRIRPSAPIYCFSVCPPNTREPLCRVRIEVVKSSGFAGMEYRVTLAQGERGARFNLVGVLAHMEGLNDLKEQIHRQLVLWMIAEHESKEFAHNRS